MWNLLKGTGFTKIPNYMDQHSYTVVTPEGIVDLKPLLLFYKEFLESHSHQEAIILLHELKVASLESDHPLINVDHIRLLSGAIRALGAM